MNNKFNEICEAFGVIQTTKKMLYPRQIKLSEEFKQALKNEYYRLTLEEDAEKPVLNRPQKFVKALQFHVADLEKNKEKEIAALRNMMDEAKKEKPVKVVTDKDIFGSPALGRSELAAKEENRKKIFKPLKKAIRKTEESTEPYQVTVKGEKEEGNKKVNLKKEDERRKEVEKENIQPLKEATVESIYESMLNEGSDMVVKMLIKTINDSIEKGKFREAKESFIALKNMKLGPTPVLAMPEYKDIFKELEAKLNKTVGDKQSAAAAEKASREAARAPEALLAAAKHCDFSHAQLGFENGWGSRSDVYGEIVKLHGECSKRDPEKHDLHLTGDSNPQRGWHDYRCKCGFGYGWDSGD